MWPVWFKFLAELDGVMSKLPDLRASNFVYLFELVLGDLLIAPAANVSVSSSEVDICYNWKYTEKISMAPAQG